MRTNKTPPRILPAAPKAAYAKLVIIVFYSVGICGMLLPFSRQLFISLFPFALLMSLVLILVYHPLAYDLRTVSAFIAVALASYLVEVAGVSTLMVFGSYRYGETLGVRLFDTPLLIGINWLILTYAGSTFAGLLGIRGLAAIPAGAALMVLYDILIEQTAPVIDMWHWEAGRIPLQNYIAWFLVSVIFQGLFRIARIDTRNPVVPVLIGAQLVFFAALLVFLA